MRGYTFSCKRQGYRYTSQKVSPLAQSKAVFGHTAICRRQRNGLIIKRGQPMNFIEHWFHVSPDAGSGLTEMSVIGAVLLAAVVVWQLRPRAARGVPPTCPTHQII